MRRIFTFIILFLSGAAFGQVGYYATRINAQTQVSPPKVTLTWKTPPSTTNGTISIYKKAKTASSWGSPIVQLPDGATTYADNNVTAGAAYEYFIQKADTTNPTGYIYAGINEPAIHNRGAILLLIDSTFSDSCNTEITTLIKDLSGDGWEVLTKTFLRTAPVATVKNHIVATQLANPKLASVYILGHLAVPYSGELNPDGHADHDGAWPADLYYGELTSGWTDVAVNNSTSSNPLNRNIPADGKFDESYIPSDIELQVGRVDFFDMPAFSNSEIQMMRNYLNKAHQYKLNALNVIKRGLIDDNFKAMPEGFAANGWRNFSTLVGIDSVSEKDLISTLNTSFYQWAYGCGGGSYTSCGGVGTTANIAANNMKCIFAPVFGSYFGDWNYKNNFLRAPLCANEPALASFWAGRPNWALHHMALGETIGYATRLSQNNSNTYFNPIPGLGRIVCIALMGDPTLRTEYVKPVPAVTLNSTDTNAGAKISWTASTEPGLAGYYVYRSTSQYGEYKLRSGLVTGTNFTDSFGVAGNYWYMVRATKLQTTPSGTYYNLSLGVSQTGTFTYPHFEVGVGELTVMTDVQLYPNPAHNTVQLSINTAGESDAIITITDLQGKALVNTSAHLSAGNNLQQLDISSLPAGMYMVNVHTGSEQKTLKLAKTY